MRVRVMCLGSSAGDDAAGLALVEPLRARGIEAIGCAHPLELVDALQGVDAAVLVDATRCGLLAPGTVHEPAVSALRSVRRLSSHGVGVGEALELAAALGRAPAHLAIVAIEAATRDGDGLSEPVRAALPEAVARVCARCADWAPAPDYSPSSSCESARSSTAPASKVGVSVSQPGVPPSARSGP